MVNSPVNTQPLLSQAIFFKKLNRVRDLVLGRENVNGEDSEGRSPLHVASFMGDSEAADYLILSGARVDKKDSRWQTPLHYACTWGRSNVVETLLTHNADIGQRDRNWQTVLHICAANNSVQCAELVLPMTTKIANMGDRTGRTPLHFAAFKGHAEMVDLLLRNESDVNARDKNERRPIHLASYAGHLDVVKQLMKAGADAGAKDKHLFSPLQFAAAGGSEAVCAYLLSETIGRVFGVFVNAPDKDGNSPLHAAVNNGKESVVQVLLAHGANINAKNTSGMTPLHLAAASTEGSACVELLIAAKAAINVKANDGRTPLHMLASYCRLKQAQCLLDNGANANAVDNEGNSALHTASRYGHDLLIKKLISAGADVKACNSHGLTPLHLACWRGYLEPVKSLIEGRADIFALDNYGRHCLHYAAFSSNNAVSCIEYLLENGASVASPDEYARLPLHYACLANSPDHVEALLKAGSDVNAPDVNGRQALHYASAQETDMKCSFLLLQHGAISGCYDNLGWTPLHYASYRGHAALAEYLISEKHGDKVENVLRRLPFSPIHLAALKGHKELLEILLRKTSRVDPRDKYGFTPLHWATYAGQIGCVKVLLQASANCLAVDRVLKTTPMHIAAGFRQTPILHMMISQHLDDSTMASAFDCRKRTPVMMSVSSGAAESVAFLLKLNPDLMLKDTKGRTALHRAAHYGSDKIVGMLLDQLRLNGQVEQAIFAHDDFGRTPFHYAAELAHSMTIAAFMRDVPPDFQLKEQQQPAMYGLYDMWGQTPLHWICFTGTVDSCDLLMDSVLKHHLSEERGGISAFHCAAFYGSEPCSEVLVERAVRNNVENTDERGRTPLHVACSQDELECIQVLLSAGAFINSVDQYGMTPLMHAAAKGHGRIVEKLLDSNADVSLVDSSKRTALHHACLKGHEDAAVSLINRSTPVILDCQDCDGKTAMHLAGKAGLFVVIERLLLAGASVTLTDDTDQTAALACASDQNTADCLQLIICGMFPENVPLSRLSSGSSMTRLSVSSQAIIDMRQGRSSNDPKYVNAIKEATSASSAQSSDSEFF